MVCVPLVMGEVKLRLNNAACLRTVDSKLGSQFAGL